METYDSFFRFFFLCCNWRTNEWFFPKKFHNFQKTWERRRQQHPMLGTNRERGWFFSGLTNATNKRIHLILKMLNGLLTQETKQRTKTQTRKRKRRKSIKHKEEDAHFQWNRRAPIKARLAVEVSADFVNKRRAASMGWFALFQQTSDVLLSPTLFSSLSEITQSIFESRILTQDE